MSLNSQQPFNQPTSPLLIILSGPSGAGKDAVLARMKELACPFEYITTMTTRPRRPNEKNNIDYHFVSVKKFQAMIENNELLEYANVYGNWYGVPRQDVKQALDAGQDVIVKVDVQGAANIKKIVPQALSVFIMTPSVDELFTRLKQRDTESHSDLALRLKTAEEEIKQIPLFDYIVVSRWGEIDRAVSEIKAIVTDEKCRVTPREIAL